MLLSNYYEFALYSSTVEKKERAVEWFLDVNGSQ